MYMVLVIKLSCINCLNITTVLTSAAASPARVENHIYVFYIQGRRENAKESLIGQCFQLNAHQLEADFEEAESDQHC
jgi:hypothetical protein